MGAETRSVRYRERAAQFRQRAQDAYTQDMRDFCNLLAEDFERLADEAEKRESPGETLRDER
jgi:hypothetical protein